MNAETDGTNASLFCLKELNLVRYKRGSRGEHRRTYEMIVRGECPSSPNFFAFPQNAYCLKFYTRLRSLFSNKISILKTTTIQVDCTDKKDFSYSRFHFLGFL